MAQKLARLGLKAVIFEGQASEPISIKITGDGVTFSGAAYLGLGCYDIVEKLMGVRGQGVGRLHRPSGDQLLSAASIQFTTPISTSGSRARRPAPSWARRS